MKKWNCNNCGRELESDLEPSRCPCGSEKIQGRVRKSRLEKLLESLKD